MENQSLGRLLIVDDEVALMTALETGLQANNYEATGFASSKEALKELETREFDLLLTDMMMPAMNGMDLLQAALAIDPNLGAIMMTGQGTIQTAIDAIKLGASDYILKPFRLRTLMPIIDRAIGFRRVRMENIQLHESLAIYEFSQMMAFTRDGETILNKVLDAAMQQCQADDASIMLVTAGDTHLEVAMARGANWEQLRGKRVPLTHGIAGWAGREQQPLILEGEVTDEQFKHLLSRPDIGPAISIPMLSAGKLIGVLNLAGRTAHRFPPGQIKALTILTNTAAAALEESRLFEELRMAETKYRSIFENAVEGIYQAGMDGKLLDANPALATTFGYETPRKFMNATPFSTGRPTSSRTIDNCSWSS